MNSSDLSDFLNLDNKDIAFRSLIEKEVTIYATLMRKKGSSIPLIFNEDEQILFYDIYIRTLLQKTISGIISNFDLTYICDCLTLGERISYETEEGKNIIFNIADPEINGGFKSHEELERMLETL